MIFDVLFWRAARVWDRIYPSSMVYWNAISLAIPPTTIESIATATTIPTNVSPRFEDTKGSEWMREGRCQIIYFIEIMGMDKLKYTHINYLKKKMRQNWLNLKRNQAFTLVEMVVSVSISTLIIAGASYFVFKTSNEAQTSKNRTQIHVDVAAFAEKMNASRIKYASGTVIIDTLSGYDVFLATNTGATNGVLVGVVSLKTPDSNWNFNLAATGSEVNYEKRALAVEELKQSQIQAILADPQKVYTITFQPDSIFTALNAQDFSATPYQSWSLFEMNFPVYDRFLDGYAWKPVDSISSEIVTLPFNLVF